MKCPNCAHEWTPRRTTIAKELGGIGGAKPKQYSDEEKQKRRDRLAVARAKRWGNDGASTSTPDAPEGSEA